MSHRGKPGGCCEDIEVVFRLGFGVLDAQPATRRNEERRDIEVKEETPWGLVHIEITI